MVPFVTLPQVCATSLLEASMAFWVGDIRMTTAALGELLRHPDAFRRTQTPPNAQ